MSELARWLREEAADWEPTGEDYEAGYRSPTAEKLREAANVVERCEQAEADRDRLAARVRELETALSNMVEDGDKTDREQALTLLRESHDPR